MAIKIGTSITARPIALPTSDETFSSRLINYVEGALVGGVGKTKIFTEVNTNLKVGDKIFIINGNYCTSKLNNEYIYNEYASGYTILEIDRCAITIDLPISNINPKNEADFNDEDIFIKTFVVNDSREVDYYDYTMKNSNGESYINPKFEFISGPDTIKDMIYNNTGSTISSPNGNILPNTFYSYILQTGGWYKTPLTSIQISNELASKKLYIMEPFVLNYNSQQINCEKSKVYHLDDDLLIKLDITYEDVFVSKSNFRFGNFKGGTWNDGVYGKKTDEVSDKRTYWEGAKWRNGIFYNSDWLQGTMESKSDKIKQQSYYGELDENGLIKQTTDFINNKSFGYNYVFESNIEKASINNANVFKASFGTFSTSNSVRDEYYLSGTNSSDITISKGLYYDCDFSYTNIENGTFELSDIENSNINNAKILDTNVSESIISETEYDSVGSVKVIDYDKQYYRMDDFGVKRIAIVHKFYMSDSDFLKIEEGDSIYFNNFISNHMDVDTLFDKEYYIGIGPEANTNGFNHGYLDNTHEVMVELKPKSKNEYKYILDSGTTSFNVLTASNDKFYNSLDLTFIVAPVDPSISSTYSVAMTENNYDSIYNGIILANEDYKSRIEVYESGRIQVSKLNSSLLTDSTWTRGSKEVSEDLVIDPTEPSLVLGRYPVMSIVGSYGSYELSVDLDYSDNRDLWRDENLDIGEIVYLNNITYDEATYSYDLSGVYNVSTYSYGATARTIQLQEYGTASQINIGVTFSLTGTYSYRNTPFKSGAVNDLKINETIINSGSFRRGFFKNSEFTNDTLNTSDTLLLKANVNKLRVFRSMLSEEDNLTLKKSFISESILKGVTVTDSLVYNCSASDMIWNGGMFYSSEWKNGTFNNGIFNGNATIGANSFTFKTLQKTDGWYSDISIPSGISMWVDGTFNNGESLRTYWYDGVFNKGKMYNSIWNDGTWYDGEFGKSTLTNTDTQFWKGEWYGGVFIKGIFGNKASVPVPATCSWFDGTFNDGEFFGATLSTTGEPAGNTVWFDGTFNGGKFSGSSKWKDGIFNGGKFSSFYGGGTGSSASNYSWESGLFNGGEFGDIFASSVSTWNSTWYNGVFEGGLFQGKVWNDGVFTGGQFLGMTGNGASSSNHYNGEPMSAVSHPENFVLSYSSEVSINNWYGMWRDGIVIDNLEDLTNKADRRFKAIRLFKGRRKPTIIFENALWVNGTFSSTSAQMRNSVWLDGQFNRGEFNTSSFNPYVPRWDFDLDGGASQSSNNGEYMHSLTSSCVWNNGTLNNSDFYISSWNNGKFLLGTMSNAEFNNGVSNYMNAYNVIWNNGRWRNGNWHGSDNKISDFFYETPLATGGSNPGRVWRGKYSGKMDGVVHQMRRHNETSLFFWSLCNISDEYNYIGTYGFISPIATNNNYHDVDAFVGGLLTDPLTSGSATNVEFGGYNSYGYDVQSVGVIAEPPGVPTPPYGLTMAVVVDGSLVPAKFGNGVFNKGIWENGVWNNGPRDVFWENTEDIKYFDSVTYYQLSKDVWQIVLTGSDNNSDISSFIVGDDISIGNIALTDINGDRKLIKDKFKVVNIDEDNNYLYVNTVVNFPIRKINIDSERHKITVTKNVWLSGLFLNGKFNGIWNNGFFKGYPCITEMYDSNWIEGTLDGGHFEADTATYSDSITGTTSWATYSTGVIQNAKIFTNIENPTETAISVTNRFDTYIDVNYPAAYGNYLSSEEWRFSSLNFDLIGSGGEDNPYVNGQLITYDILSSVTHMLIRPNVYYNFKLGVKLEEFENLISEPGKFDGIQNPDRLENHGWEFTTSQKDVSGTSLKLPGGPTLSSTQSVFLASDNDFNYPQPSSAQQTGLPLNQMNIDVQGANKYFVYHDDQYDLNKLRYTRIDIDIENLWSPTGATAGYLAPYPGIAFAEGVQYVDLANRKGDTFKVSKFFWNRPVNDPMYAVGGDVDFGLRVDNAKYIELDMIPFMNYFDYDDENINCDPRIPYEATAPFIDYADTDFSFIDNVTFEFNQDAVVAPAPAPPIYQTPSESTSGDK